MHTRVVKAHDVRKEEILDCAERLFASIGYERATVNAIIEETAIAKGTFYHYFAGKEELLNSLVERLAARILAAVAPIQGEDAPAPEKLRRIHETAGAIKSGHAAVLMEYLRVYYKPENLLARHKMTEKALETTIPIYAAVIRQGVDEGVFDTVHPLDAAELLLRAWSALGDTIARLLLDSRGRPGSLQEARRKLAAYAAVAERVLGAAAGSLGLADAGLRVLQAFEGSLDQRDGTGPEGSGLDRPPRAAEATGGRL